MMVGMIVHYHDLTAAIGHRRCRADWSSAMPGRLVIGNAGPIGHIGDAGPIGHIGDAGLIGHRP